MNLVNKKSKQTVGWLVWKVC